MDALQLYSRWWGLETWLRELVYIELRAQFGREWTSKVSERARKRQSTDEVYDYMASSDATNLLAYEDVGLVFRLISGYWELFEPSLFRGRSRWEARVEELLQIRHRIGHCRRPHADDLARLEQTLRDLEPGAWTALTSYNRDLSVGQDLDDPVAEAWVREGCDDARRLVRHAERQYETSLHLNYAVRPWAEEAPGQAITGRAGVFWYVRFIMRGGRHLSTRRIVEEWGEGGLPDSVVHALADDPFHVRFTLPALEDPDTVVKVVGELFDGILTSSTVQPWPDDDEEGLRHWNAVIARLDHRVQSDTPLAIVDSTLPRMSVLLT
jgi:hypothetical protein